MSTFNVNIPYGYCHCGCGEKTNIISKSDSYAGRVKGEPYKYLLNHDKRLTTPEYVVDKKTGCWEWQRCKNAGGYGTIHRNRRYILAHVFYYEKYVGSVGDGLELDHICHNTGCVNPKHLRAVTRSQNQQNRFARKNCTSKYKGVCWYKQTKKWRASIRVDNKVTNLGYFKNEVSAAIAYDIAAHQYFGEFSHLNFPERDKL